MAIKNRLEYVYGMGQALIQLPPRPIVARRDPTTRDLAQIGSMWINTVTGVFFGLSRVVAGAASWVSTPAAGATILASLTVTGAGGIIVDVGNIDVTLGDINVGGNVDITGNLDVAGVLTFTGDLDLTSAALIDLTSTLNAAPSIYLHANGGVLEQIRIHADQGTSVNSIELDSDDGGITLVSGLASADAINLSATGGGVDIDGALQVNIASSQNAADAIVINASAGGIDITNTGTAGEDIDISSTGASVNLSASENVADAIVLNASAGGIDITAAGAPGEDIDITNTAGSVNITAGESAANSIVISSTIGGIDITCAGAAAGEDLDLLATGSSVNITSTEAVADAIVMNATYAAGGVQIRAGSAGILVGTDADTAVISIGDVVPTAARTITVGGGAVATAIADTIDIAPDGANTDAGASKVLTLNNGGVTLGTLTTNIASGAVTSGTHTVNIATGARAAGTAAINISTGTGTKTVNLGNADGLTTYNIDATTLIADSVNVNTSINTGTSTGIVAIGNAAAGAVTIDTAAGISLDAATASNFTVTGAENLTLASSAGRVIVNGEQAVANAITFLSAAGGVDTDCALQMNLDSSQAAATAVRVNASNAAGGIDIDAGTGGIAIDTTGAISLDAAAASNFTATGAFDVTISSTAGSVIVNGGEAVADAVRLVSAAGGVDLDCALQLNLASSQNAASAVVLTASAGGIDITATGAAAGEDIDIVATGSSVNITSTEADTNAIVLTASNAAGGINLISGATGGITINGSGNVQMTPTTATVASPGASVTINNRVGVATYTGFTTAAAGTQTFTITNSVVSEGDGILLTVANSGTNDAQMDLRRVDTEGGGAIVVDTINNGAAALNGDVVITFWILN